MPFQIAIMLLALTLSPAVIGQQHPSARRGYEGTTLQGEHLEMPFVRWGRAIMLENVMVNGKGPYRFILDTGAEGAGRVDVALVESLSLPVLGQSDTVGLLGEARVLNKHRVDSLSFGGLTFTGITMSSRDYNADRPSGLRPIHGILGYHLFNEYLLTIDYPARKIIISRGELPPPDGEVILSLISDDEDPELDVSLAGVSVHALLDTGAMGPLGVNSATAEQLSFTAEPVVRGRQGDVELRSATLAGALQIGAVEISQPSIMIASQMPTAVVGIEILSSLSLTFDQKNARVRIERPVPRKRYGLEIATSSPPVLRNVTPESIAARAGVLASDRIVSINGQPVERVSLEDLFQVLDAPTLVLVVERDGARHEYRLTLE